MTTGYNIACTLHSSLVSVPFYAIPISLSKISFFKFTSIHTFFIEVDVERIISNIILGSLKSIMHNVPVPNHRPNCESPSLASAKAA